MTHTLNELISRYKEQHEQFRPKRIDTTDWNEAIDEMEAKPRNSKTLTLPHKV